MNYLTDNLALFTVEGLGHEIDFKTIDRNGQI